MNINDMFDNIDIVSIVVNFMLSSKYCKEYGPLSTHHLRTVSLRLVSKTFSEATLYCMNNPDLKNRKSWNKVYGSPRYGNSSYRLLVFDRGFTEAFRTMDDSHGISPHYLRSSSILKLMQNVNGVLSVDAYNSRFNCTSIHFPKRLGVVGDLIHQTSIPTPQSVVLVLIMTVGNVIKNLHDNGLTHGHICGDTIAFNFKDSAASFSVFDFHSCETDNMLLQRPFSLDVFDLAIVCLQLLTKNISIKHYLYDDNLRFIQYREFRNLLQYEDARCSPAFSKLLYAMLNNFTTTTVHNMIKCANDMLTWLYYTHPSGNTPQKIPLPHMLHKPCLIGPSIFPGYNSVKFEYKHKLFGNCMRKHNIENSDQIWANLILPYLHETVRINISPNIMIRAIYIFHNFMFTIPNLQYIQYVLNDIPIPEILRLSMSASISLASSVMRGLHAALDKCDEIITSYDEYIERSATGQMYCDTINSRKLECIIANVIDPYSLFCKTSADSLNKNPIVQLPCSVSTLLILCIAFTPEFDPDLDHVLCNEILYIMQDNETSSNTPYIHKAIFGCPEDILESYLSNAASHTNSAISKLQSIFKNIKCM